MALGKMQGNPGHPQRKSGIATVDNEAFPKNLARFIRRIFRLQ